MARPAVFLAKLLSIDAVDAVVARCVRDVEAIDVHTHLLPPTHGNLLLWGIDELLTYHYLVAELFMVMPCVSEEDSVSVGDAAPSPDDFYGWPKPRQAELVFEELFVKRTPLSEACRGVVTTLSRLGRGEQLRAAVRLPSRPRLTALRDWFAAQDASDHLERVFRLSKLKYAGAGAAERRREPVNGASSHTSGANSHDQHPVRARGGGALDGVAAAAADAAAQDGAAGRPDVRSATRLAVTARWSLRLSAPPPACQACRGLARHLLRPAARLAAAPTLHGGLRRLPQGVGAAHPPDLPHGVDAGGLHVHADRSRTRGRAQAAAGGRRLGGGGGEGRAGGFWRRVPERGRAARGGRCSQRWLEIDPLSPRD